jgi:small-conductance mechanosensitive channel
MNLRMHAPIPCRCATPADPEPGTRRRTPRPSSGPHGGGPRPGLALAVVALLWCAVVAPPAVAASGSAYGAAHEPAGDTPRAPVTLDGHVIARIRGITSHPAEKRAEIIEGRLAALAADRSVPSDELRLQDAGDRTNLLAGDRLIMSVFEADAELEGIPRGILADAIRQRAAYAITAYRTDRSPRVLIVHTLYGLGATVAAGLLLLGLRMGFRRLSVVVERRFRARVEALEAQSRRVLQARELWALLQGAIRLLRALAVIVLTYAYLNFVLSLYPWTRPLAAWLFDLVLDPLRTIATGLVAQLPKVAFLAVLFLLVRYVLKLIRLFFTGIDRGSITPAGFEREWAWPTYRIVRLLIVVFALVVAYPYIPGSESAAFKGISLFLGVIFSLGSSSIIGNVIAGYSLTYRRAFKIGDRIRIGELVGDVAEIKLLVVRLRSLKNEEIVIPSSVVLSSNVINYSTLARQEGLILHTTVGIGYETPWRQVEAMLLLAAERTAGRRRDRTPFVLQQALGDFCVTYELNIYCENAQAMARVYTELHRNILDVFNEYGVQIMTPAYEGDPATPKVVPKDQWFLAPAPAPKAT